MIEQSLEEVTEAMRHDPKGWAQLYLSALEVIKTKEKLLETYRIHLAMHNIPDDVTIQ